MAHTNYSRNSLTGGDNVTLEELKLRKEYEITNDDKAKLVSARIKSLKYDIDSLERQYSTRKYLDFHDSNRLNEFRITLKILVEHV